MGDVSAVSGCLSGPSLAAASFVSSWASAREAALCRAALCCHRRSLRFWLHRIPTAAVWMHSRWFLLCCLKFKPRQFWSTHFYTNVWKDDLSVFAFNPSFILIVVTECSVPLLFSCKAVVCCGVPCILQKFFRSARTSCTTFVWSVRPSAWISLFFPLLLFSLLLLLLSLHP